jgi:hypothetical protein
LPATALPAEAFAIALPSRNIIDEQMIDARREAEPLINGGRIQDLVRLEHLEAGFRHGADPALVHHPRRFRLPGRAHGDR